MRAKLPFLIPFIALGAVVVGCKLSYDLHRHRLPDFTLDVDPSHSWSLRFRFSRDGAHATLTTTIYENRVGLRGNPITIFQQVVSAADVEGLAASMKQVSFFDGVDDSDVRDGTTWSLRLDSFPFASQRRRDLYGSPGLQEIGDRLLAISRPLREERSRPKNTAP